MTFDLCVLAADNNGFHGPSQLTNFFAHGSYGLFTRNCEGKGPQYLEQVTVYVCPGGRRDWNQIEKWGGVDSFYCAAWGCETSGTVPWPINPGNGLIQIKLPQNTPKCRSQGISSKPGQCFPLQIKFTYKGKKYTRWDVGQAWGLCLYKIGFDNGVRFELKDGTILLDPQGSFGTKPGDSPKTFLPGGNPKTSLPEPKSGYWTYSTHSSHSRHVSTYRPPYKDDLFSISYP